TARWRLPVGPPAFPGAVRGLGAVVHPVAGDVGRRPVTGRRRRTDRRGGLTAPRTARAHPGGVHITSALAPSHLRQQRTPHTAPHAARTRRGPHTARPTPAPSHLRQQRTPHTAPHAARAWPGGACG